MTKARDLGDFISDGTIAETVTADGLNLGDNEKIQLGASQDLQIFHDGTNSVIKDAGTGNLNLLSDQFAFKNAAGTENQFVAGQDGAVTLYYDNAAKLATTSTGVTVTGTIAVSDSFNATSGTFTVQSNGTDILNLTSTVMSPQTDGAIDFGTSIARFRDIHLSGTSYANNTQLELTPTNSDSPVAVKIINNASGSGTGGRVVMGAGSGSLSQTAGVAGFFDGTGTSLAFYTSSSYGSSTQTERVRIDRNGSFIVNNSGGDAQVYLGGTSGSSRMYLARAGNNSFLWNVDSGYFTLATNNAERFRIGSSGELGIGGATYGTSGQVLTSGGSGAAPTWADAGGGGAQFDFTADGAITAGNVVALTGAGKAKVTEASDFAGPTAANTSLNISGDQCLDVGICPRTGRGLIAYVNGSTSIYANGFTQSGGTFTFGSAAFVQNGSAKQENVAVIATGRADGEFAVFYQYSSNNYIQVRIMTVASDRSVTDRDSTTYNVDNQSDQILWTSGCALYGGANQTSPVILCLHDNKYAGDNEYYPALTAIQVNSSSVSVGSTTNGLNAGSGSGARISYPSIVYDSTNTRMIVTWKENGGNQSIRYVTTSGTTLSVGSRIDPDIRDDNNTLREFNITHSPDADYCVAVFYGGTSKPKVAQAIDNTGSKVGAVLVLEDGTSDTSNRADREALLYDPDKQHVVLKGVARIHSSSHYAYYACKVNSSGGLSNVTAVGAPIFIATTDNSYRFNNSKGKMGSVYDTYSNTIYGGIVTDADSDPRVFTVTVGTTFDYLGIADGSASDGGTVTVNLAGSVDENQSGLSSGSVYFTGDNGALALSGDRKVGKALSASAILITQAND